MINRLPPHCACTEDKTRAHAERLALQRHAAPGVLADAHVLQESNKTSGRPPHAAEQTSLSVSEVGVVLRAKQTAQPYVSII